MVLVVAFAQDGVDLLRVACLGDEVDAGVFGGDAVFRRADLLGPIGEEPHGGADVGAAGLAAEVGADEFVEAAAFFAPGLGGGALFGEDALEGVAGLGLPGGEDGGKRECLYFRGVRFRNLGR